MRKLISVIIPVFNVKAYLDECLESVINQTYKELEIIIIDDGSTDGSSDICDNYVQKDNRIKLIRQENKGLSVARNVGIENSSSEFIMFVDSDDFIHKEMIEVLYNNLVKNNADISFCNFTRDRNELKEKIKNKPIVMEKYKVYEELYNRNNPVVYSCTKLFKKVIFSDIRYPIGKIYEDAFIIHRLIDKAKKIVYTDEKLYYYRIREGSITEQKYTLRVLDYLDVLRDRMRFMKEKGYDYFYAREFYRYINKLKWNYNQIKKYFPDEKLMRKELLLEFDKMYNKDSRKLIMNKKLRWKMDLFYLKVRINKDTNGMY